MENAPSNIDFLKKMVANYWLNINKDNRMAIIKWKHGKNKKFFVECGIINAIASTKRLPMNEIFAHRELVKFIMILLSKEPENHFLTIKNLILSYHIEKKKTEYVNQILDDTIQAISGLTEPKDLLNFAELTYHKYKNILDLNLLRIIIGTIGIGLEFKDELDAVFYEKLKNLLTNESLDDLNIPDIVSEQDELLNISNQIHIVKKQLLAVIAKLECGIIPNEDYSQLQDLYKNALGSVHVLSTNSKFLPNSQIINDSEIDWCNFSVSYKSHLSSISLTDERRDTILSRLHKVILKLIQSGVKTKDVMELILDKIKFEDLKTLKFDPDTVPHSIQTLIDYSPEKHPNPSNASEYFKVANSLRNEFSDEISFVITKYSEEFDNAYQTISIQEIKEYISVLITEFNQNVHALPVGDEQDTQKTLDEGILKEAVSNNIELEVSTSVTECVEESGEIDSKPIQSNTKPFFESAEADLATTANISKQIESEKVENETLPIAIEVDNYHEADICHKISTHKFISESQMCASNIHYGRVILFIDKLNKDIIDSKKILPKWIFEAIFYSLYFDELNEELKALIKNRLNQDYFEVFVEEKSDWNASLRLLLFSAAAISAITMSDSNGMNIIRDLKFKDDFTEMANLCKVFVDFANAGNILEQHRLEAIVKGKTHDEISNDWKAKAHDLKHNIQHRPLSYIPAKKVLNSLISKDGEITILLDAVINGSDGLSKEVLSMANMLSDQVAAAVKINQINSKVNNRHIEIKNFSFDFLVSRLKSSAEIALRWNEFVTSHKSTSNTFANEQTKILMNNFSSMKPKVEAILNEKTQNPPSPLMALSAQSAALIIKKLGDILDGQRETSVYSVPIPNVDFLFLHPNQILNLRAVSGPSSTLERDFNKLATVDNQEQRSLIENIYNVLSTAPLGLQELQNAAYRQMNNGQFDYAEYLGRNFQVSPEFKNNYAELLKKSRNQLSQVILETNDIIESAVIDNLLLETEREEYKAIIGSMTPETELNIYYRMEEIKSIHNSINNKRQELIEILGSKIKLMSIEDEIKVSLIQKLKNGEIETASSQIDLLERGDRIFDFKEKPSLYSEYLKVYESIEQNLFESGRSIHRKIEKLERGSKFMGLNMPSEGPRLRDSRILLMNWFELKEDKTINNKSIDKLKEILISLHFDVNSLLMEDRKQGQNYQVINFTTSTTPKSPIPLFGSVSNGFFNLICFWERPSEVEIISVLNNRPTRSATILFYFARFDKSKKKAMFKAWHNYKRTVLVIDDILLAFIASRIDISSEVLFECALPNTFNNPFHTIAGKVPKEIFFGRREEIDSLVNPTGSCIIYGGRQLGKTAILKTIESMYHSPEKGQIVIYLDLKVRGFGTIHTSSDPIFEILGIECHNLGILNSSESKKADKILSGIKNWLDTDKARRIMVLMDEADLFIELDAKEGLKSIEKLKGLMDSSNNRFKFVLSGLHNVERFSMISNSTIAHLKTRGVHCIGPLINNGEHIAAKKMVILPFKYLGFEFEEQESVYRILGYTNYYPSLIQLFGYYLMLELSDRIKHSADVRNIFPFKITKEIIDFVYLKGGKLKNEIVDRFQWTLNLDSRYELLALVLALECIDKKTTISQGLSLKEIISLIEYWDEKKIFGGGLPERDNVNDLLTEMIGLGIIRSIENGNFTLKNPNILRLLGSKTQIEDRIVLINSRTDNRVLDISTARRLHSSKLSICPYTARQEQIIMKIENSVVLICGSYALGINDVVDYLRESLRDYPQYNKTEFVRYDAINNKMHESQLEVFLERKQDKPEMLVIDFTEIINESLIEYSLIRMKRRGQHSSVKKIIYVLSDYFSNDSQSGMLLENLRRTQFTFDIVTLKKITPIALSRWANHVMAKRTDKLLSELGFWSGLYNFVRENNFDLESKDVFNETDLIKLDIFSIKDTEIKLFLKDIAEFDCEFSRIEIADMVESIALKIEKLNTFLEICIEREYFIRLHTDHGVEKYCIDPVLKRFLMLND